MRRFFVPSLPSVGSTSELPPAVRRHVAVLRLEEGAEIALFDGSGREAHGRLVGDRVEILSIGEAHEAGPRRVLVQVLPKGTKADEIVRMATELGVHAIHFALGEHGVARPDDARGSKKTTRWQRIAEEAARQSERAVVPTVHAPAPLDEVMRRAPEDALRLVAWARGGQPIGERRPTGDELWIAVGPEGGFSTRELAAFDEAGWARVTLGRNVLRVDTAALAALAQLAAFDTAPTG